MKIHTLLKPAFIYYSLLQIAGLCMLQLNPTLSVSFSETNLSSVQIGLAIIEILLATVYWTIRDEYDSLTKTSTSWLVILLIISGLSLTASVFIDPCFFYIPVFIKKANLFAYLLFVPVSLAMFIVQVILFFIILQSAQTLRVRFNSNKLPHNPSDPTNLQ